MPLVARLFIVGLWVMFGSHSAFGQTIEDETQPVSAQNQMVVKTPSSPQGALWRSAVAPGWGQIYNKQYIKLPFVYAALGGLIYNAVTSHQDYVLYREAFQYKAFQEQVDAGTITVNPRSSFSDSYQQVASEFGAVSSRPLEAQRNIFRRSRDLSFVGVGLVYGLAMLDAYVSAHLLDFDVGENLSIQVEPRPGGISLKALVPLERRAYRGLSYR
ncbi:MAG: DUF5683 domain-containing protein [Bacteroidetes bacterium]|nr:DUF5683 domain-containing protein [Bacteroidota bacterium]